VICCLCVCVCLSMALCVVLCHNYQSHRWDVLVTIVTKDCRVLHSKARSDDREITRTHTLRWHTHKQKANSPTPSYSLSQSNISMLNSILHIKWRLPSLIRPITRFTWPVWMEKQWRLQFVIFQFKSPSTAQ